MFPIFLIAIGLAVLAFGTRLTVLGAAVGALFGVALLRLLPGSQGTWFTLGLPVLLAVLGGIGSGFMQGILRIAALVVGAIAGAAIVIAFFDLLNLNLGWIDWLCAAIGAGVGLVLVRRYRDWGRYILVGLVGALLVMRGLGILLPALEGTFGTLLTLVIAGGAIAYHGGLLSGLKLPSTASSGATDDVITAASVPPVAPDTQMQ